MFHFCDKIAILFSICPRLLREGVFFFWGYQNSNFLLLYTFWASLFKSLIHLITSSFFLFIRIIFLSTNFYFLETTLSYFHFLTWEYQGFFMPFLQTIIYWCWTFFWWHFDHRKEQRWCNSPPKTDIFVFCEETSQETDQQH